MGGVAPWPEESSPGVGGWSGAIVAALGEPSPQASPPRKKVKAMAAKRGAGGARCETPRENELCPGRGPGGTVLSTRDRNNCEAGPHRPPEQ